MAKHSQLLQEPEDLTHALRWTVKCLDDKAGGRVALETAFQGGTHGMSWMENVACGRFLTGPGKVIEMCG